MGRYLASFSRSQGADIRSPPPVRSWPGPPVGARDNAMLYYANYAIQCWEQAFVFAGVGGGREGRRKTSVCVCHRCHSKSMELALLTDETNFKFRLNAER